MDKLYVALCIFLSAAVTYILRALPVTLLKKPVKSTFFKSFLHYAPYVTLAVITFPSVISCTGNVYIATAGFVVAILCSLFFKGFFATTVSSCVAVYILELLFC